MADFLCKGQSVVGPLYIIFLGAERKYDYNFGTHYSTLEYPVKMGIKLYILFLMSDLLKILPQGPGRLIDEDGFS